MGLAGRKVKQRIGPDPRNLAWSDDAARFGHEYLSKFGWSPSTGLGAAQDGRTTNVTLTQKLNLFGIGAERTPGGPDDIAWKQNKDFEGVLARLNQADTDASPQDTIGDEGNDESEVKGEPAEERKKSKKSKGKRSRDEMQEDGPTPNSNEADTVIAPKRNAHRAKYLASKRMANLSATAMSEILGIAPTASSPSSSTPTPISTPMLQEDHIKNTNQSVNDYFKEKMQAKLAERERLAAQVAPTKGVDEGTEEPTTLSLALDEKREQKRRRKEEKAKAKASASQEEEKAARDGRRG